MSQAIAFVFARGGSKGVPGKNLRELAGLPLIAHAIRTAKAVDSISRVVVSTDDARIADIAQQHGAEVPFIRPAELASDEAPEWLAWQHAIREVQRTTSFDTFVSLPATAPLRAVEDVQACLDLLHNTPDTDMVITGTPAARSPWFNQLGCDEQGYSRPLLQDDRITRRQDAPCAWDMTTVAYVSRPAHILSASGVFDGRVRLVEVPAHRALDIDSSWDFAMAELIAARFGIPPRPEAE